MHEELTRQWALDTGFSAEDAVTIARWDWNVDVGWPGRPWRNKRYHHLLWGGPRLAREYFAWAVRERSLPHLGVALHIRQDVIGHGLLGSLVHWPAMDRWEGRSEALRIRIEMESKRMLSAYREEVGGGNATGGGGESMVSVSAEDLLGDPVLPLPPV